MGWRVWSLLATALALTAALALSTSREPGPPLNVIVVLIDTLRVDALGAYGQVPSPSPTIDAFARRGVTFDRAFATAPWTRPSVASLFTSRLPSHLGILSEDASHALDGSFPTLAAYFEKLGYETAAFAANGHLLQLQMEQFGTHHVEPAEPADRLTGRALRWLKQRTGPFFLYLHYLDPHYPYRRHPQTGFGTPREFTQLPRPGRVVGTCEMRFVDDDTRDALWANYLSEVAFVDAELERLRRALEDVWDDTVLVITSDHGEMFGEHDQWEHGCSLHRQLLQVPLIFTGGPIRRRARMNQLVSLLDVFPTLVGLTAPETLPGAPLSGRSLAAALLGHVEQSPTRAYAVASNGFRQPVAHSVTDGTYQLWRMPVGSVELWDLRSDAKVDAPPRSHTVRALDAALDEALRAPPGWPAAPRGKRVPNVELDEATREALRSMGYVAD